MKEQDKNKPQAKQVKKPILNVDEGKSTPPHGLTNEHAQSNISTTKPEQEPDVPPHDRTLGNP